MYIDLLSSGPTQYLRTNHSADGGRLSFKLLAHLLLLSSRCIELLFDRARKLFATLPYLFVLFFESCRTFLFQQLVALGASLAQCGGVLRQLLFRFSIKLLCLSDAAADLPFASGENLVDGPEQSTIKDKHHHCDKQQVKQ